MRAYFFEIKESVQALLGPKEAFTANFSAEIMDYARFNHAKIRQAGTVEQHYLSLRLIVGKKHALSKLALFHDKAKDKAQLEAAFKRLRAQIQGSAEDPFLLVNEKPSSSEHIEKHELSDKTEVVSQILNEAEGLDLVGCYIAGPMYRGFFNSFGQENWFEKSSFVLDSSIYHSKDRAIKQSYAGARFDHAVFREKIKETRLGLKLFDQEALTLSPGSYRVYFSPSAVFELLSMLNWGGFSQKAIESKSSSLMALFDKKKSLSPKFTLSENIQASIGPSFQSQGFIKKPKITLIDKGILSNTMISPKTAQEYKLDHNGADDAETVSSFDMAAGNLPKSDLFEHLDNGLIVNNLWYLNFSDRQNGRITGMTRFLSYVLRNGKPTASFSVMRFDDSIYRIFGENLEELTKERDFIVDNSTYEERSSNCALLPGIVVNNVNLTL